MYYINYLDHKYYFKVVVKAIKQPRFLFCKYDYYFITLVWPNYIKDKAILPYINSCLKDIYNFVNNFKISQPFDLYKKTILINNNWCTLKLIKVKTNKAAVLINYNLYIFVKDINNLSLIFLAIKKFMLSQAKVKILQLVKEQSTIMKIKYNNLNFKWFKNKWGYCNVKTKDLCFNSQLICYSDQTINYVIIHELSHIVFANHSKVFWQLVQKYCPDYKNIAKQLSFKK